MLSCIQVFPSTFLFLPAVSFLLGSQEELGQICLLENSIKAVLFCFFKKKNNAIHVLLNTQQIFRDFLHRNPVCFPVHQTLSEKGSTLKGICSPSGKKGLDTLLSWSQSFTAQSTLLWSC